MQNQTAILIGSFQTDTLTLSEHAVFMKLIEVGYSDVLIILTDQKPQLIDPVPLPFLLRKYLLDEQLKRQYPNKLKWLIVRLQNYAMNEVWSEKLDGIIDSLGLTSFDFVVAKESYKRYYTGKFQNNFNEVLETSDLSEPNGRRSEVARDVFNFSSLGEAQVFARALIWSSMSRRPQVQPTVDFILYTREMKYILLGRKKNETYFRLPGGFVDVTDKSYEEAALRELEEETGVKSKEVEGMRLLTSSDIKDWRYEGVSDSIITTIVIGKFLGMPNSVKANDDLVEVKWHDIDTLSKYDIYPPHKKILLNINHKR